ncbi:class I SAM-dependent methyltransferase, partial [Candidatus Roizmanbacteria bacterium]|nr:class I SAM-dependent methyltransferase [Candidatus Roizmanbacteria bacterium]
MCTCQILGCGDGERLFEFSRRGYEVWGIDVGAHSIDVCRRILPKAQFFQGELQEASLEAGQFDFVRIDNALEHMPNPGIVIMETYRILKSSGKIMIYVPNGRSFTMRFLKGGSISSWMPFHLQLFTKRSLFKLLQDNGFKDIKIYGYNPPTWIPMSIIQSLNISRNRVPPSYPKWLDKVFLPLGWIFVCIGLSEELMAVA